jgi:hypothetical protein
MIKLIRHSLLSSTVVVLLFAIIWFLISKRVNTLYVEAMDPSIPNGESTGSLIRMVHMIMMFPLMPLLPMDWLSSHWGGLTATRIVMVSLIFNSLLWGFFLYVILRLLTQFCQKHRQ